MFLFNKSKAINRPVIGLYLILLLTTLFFSSCEKFVDVGYPRTQLLDSLVFKDFKTAETALLQVYIDVRYNSEVSAGCGLNYQLYVDDLTNYSVDPESKTFKFFNTSLTDKDENLLTRHWDARYSAIYKANKLLVGLDQSAAITVANRNQLKGEALVLRSLMHWRLANSFGDVPFITDVDYRVTVNAPKLPKSKVFELVQKDVELAASLLPDNYPTADRVRINKKVAQAFLAQIYLYSKKWKEAEDLATELINATGTYALETDLTKTFLRQSKETIWHFAESNPGSPTSEALHYAISVSPFTNTAYVAMSDDLLNSFEPDDKRRNAWIGINTVGQSSWNYMSKYKVLNTIASGSPELSVVMRLSEMYLIRAEARIERENFSGAQQDIDAIRGKAGLPGTTATDKPSLREAVMQERRHELFCEGAHRYYDLKRTGTITQVLGLKKPNWTEAAINLPISEKQKILNPNLQ